MEPELARLLAAAAGLEARGVSLAVIGGVARSTWASKRSTLDVDVIAAVDNVDEVTALAAAVGLTTQADEVAALKQADMTRLRLAEHPRGEVRLDVIAAIHPYHRRVIARAVAVAFGAVVVHVACAEDVVVLKCLAGRPQDLADIDAIVRAQGALLKRDLIRAECQALDLEPPVLAEGR